MWSAWTSQTRTSRFETALARGYDGQGGNLAECRDVNTAENSTGPGCQLNGKYPGEKVVDIATRLCSDKDNSLAAHLCPAVALNADFFDHINYGHGPEGLTVKNGERFDGWRVSDCDTQFPPTLDENGRCYGNDVNRSSLTIFAPQPFGDGRGPIKELDDPASYIDRYYNAVGGLPLLVSDGAPVNIDSQCAEEGGGCPDTWVDRARTTVGRTADDKLIVVVVREPPGVTLKELADIMVQYGAVEAMNLDGGGSSQLWYREGSDLKGASRVAGSRGVADAILIFREDIPRHDAFLSFQDEYPIVEPGQRVEYKFELRNTGFLAWDARLPYALMHSGGDDLGLPTWHPIPASALIWTDITWTLRFVAPATHGAYQSRWQMVYRDNVSGAIESIGPEIGFILTVLPEDRSPNFADIIRQMIDQAQQEAEQRLMSS